MYQSENSIYSSIGRNKSYYLLQFVNSNSIIVDIVFYMLSTSNTMIKISKNFINNLFIIQA